MQNASYVARRGQLHTYFDRTAADAWAKLTSDAPLSKIRATVRAGRDTTRATILGWLPADLTGRRVLDAGCGTGTLAADLARRGADVVAIDLSPTLVDLGRERIDAHFGLEGRGSIEFRSGDMLDAALGRFDHVVAMDSLIHYRAADMAEAVARLAARTSASMVFTFAPRTPALTLLHAAGQLFPRADRSPAIEPIRPGTIRRRLGRVLPPGASLGRTNRVATGFYISQALEVVTG